MGFCPCDGTARILDAAEQALFTAVLYHYTVKNFADPLALTEAVPYVVS